MLSASISKSFCFSNSRDDEKNSNKVGKKHIMTTEARCSIWKRKIYPLPSVSVVNCTKSSQKIGKRWNIISFYGKLIITAHMSRYILKLHFNHISEFCFTTNFRALLQTKIYKRASTKGTGLFIYVPYTPKWKHSSCEWLLPKNKLQNAAWMQPWLDPEWKAVCVKGADLWPMTHGMLGEYSGVWKHACGT